MTNSNGFNFNFEFENGKVLTINRKKAEHMLERNTNNRPVNQARVDQIARDMISGDWVFNGQSVTFDTDGVQMDKQHTLLGVVKSGVTIKMPVFYNVDKRAKRTIDTGRGRTFSDNLGINGELHSRTLGSAVKFLYLWKHGKTLNNTSGGKIPSMAEMYEVLGENPKIRKGVDSIMTRHKGVRLYGSNALFSTLYYLFSKKDHDSAELFFEYFGSGDGLGVANPIFSLREKLTKERLNNTHTRVGSWWVGAMTIKAWNAMRTSSTCKGLRFNPVKEDYPRIK